jgi:hypothetical protein
MHREIKHEPSVIPAEWLEAPLFGWDKFENHLFGWDKVSSKRKSPSHPVATRRAQARKVVPPRSKGEKEVFKVCLFFKKKPFVSLTNIMKIHADYDRPTYEEATSWL